jgi:hypothetical protein
LRIVQVVNQAGGGLLSTGEIYELLRGEYGLERQFDLRQMDWHLTCVRAVGLLEGLEPYWGDDGRPYLKYRITEAGRKKLAWLGEVEDKEN